MSLKVFRGPVLCLLTLAALALTPPAAAATLTQAALSGANYSCVVDPLTASDDCTLGVVNASYPSSNKARAVVDLNASFNWASLVVRVETCNGSGYTVHVADSPTNNGFGGDAGSTQHDAEAHTVGTTLYVYRSDIGSGSPLRCQFGGPSSVSGCIVQDWIVRPDELSFDSSTFSSNSLERCLSPDLFDFPSYDEADSEDTTGAYEDKLYVGLNRTYGSASRSGSGVQRACFFLSTDSSPNFSTIGSECGF
jgi:hypothetical protein